MHPDPHRTLQAPRQRPLRLWQSTSAPEWDARERTRLELVGLASEIATQANRTNEALQGIGNAALLELGEAAREMAMRAWAVLEPQASVHYFSQEVLERVLVELRRDQRDMLMLRERVDRLVKNAYPTDRLLWKSLRAGFHVR
jgi:hypothetical protein